MKDDTEELGTFYDVVGPNETLRNFEAGIDDVATCCEEMTDTRFRFYIDPGAGAAIDIGIFHNAAEALDLAVIEMEPGDAPTADWRPKKVEAANG